MRTSSYKNCILFPIFLTLLTTYQTFITRQITVNVLLDNILTRILHMYNYTNIMNDFNHHVSNRIIMIKLRKKKGF